MATKKYLGDYRLENRVNPKTGKVKTVPVYRGQRFAFDAKGTELLSIKRFFTAMTALCVVAFVVVTVLNAPCGHAMYVMLPFAAMVFPLYFAGASCLRMLRAGEWVTREHHDKTGDRYASCTLAMTVLAAMSLIGHVIYVCLNGLTGKDGISLAATAAAFACSAAMLRRRRDLDMHAVSES